MKVKDFDGFGEWIVKRLSLKNADLLIAAVLIVILLLVWDYAGFKELFGHIINIVFPNSYGVPRTRVLADRYVLIPIVFCLGYFHGYLKYGSKKSGSEV